MQPSSTTSYQTFRLQCAHGSVPSCMSDCWRLASRTCTKCLNPPATEQEIRPGINGGNEMRRWLHSGEKFGKVVIFVSLDAA